MIVSLRIRSWVSLTHLGDFHFFLRWNNEFLFCCHILDVESDFRERTPGFWVLGMFFQPELSFLPLSNKEGGLNDLLPSTSTLGFHGSCCELPGLILESLECFLLFCCGILLCLYSCGTWWVFWFYSWLTVFPFSFLLICLSKDFFLLNSFPVFLHWFFLDSYPHCSSITQDLFVPPVSGDRPKVCFEGYLCSFRTCSSHEIAGSMETGTLPKLISLSFAKWFWHLFHCIPFLLFGFLSFFSFCINLVSL